MKFSDLKAGDEVIADAGFDCLRAGTHKVESDSAGLFIPCKKGRHYLSGQEGDDGDLIGLSRANQ
jgi:hypothetical protein